MYGGVAHARPLLFQRVSTLAQKITTICRIENNFIAVCPIKALFSLNYGPIPQTVFLSVNVAPLAQDHATQQTTRKH